MNRSTLITLKVLTWVACLSPAALLVYEAVTNTLGPDPTSTITLTTGYNALLMLILSLAVTPVRPSSHASNGSSNSAGSWASSPSSMRHCISPPTSRST